MRGASVAPVDACVFVRAGKHIRIDGQRLDPRMLRQLGHVGRVDVSGERIDQGMLGQDSVAVLFKCQAEVGAVPGPDRHDHALGGGALTQCLAESPVDLRARILSGRRRGGQDDHRPERRDKDTLDGLHDELMQQFIGQREAGDPRSPKCRKTNDMCRLYDSRD